MSVNKVTSMSADLPTISIVTPTLNRARFLEGAIKSVVTQDYPRLEYIVIDGGSEDGSTEIIRQYEQRIAFWCSEKDNGQADALAKGFRRSKGEVLNWLNSDDRLLPGALFAVADAYRRHGPSLIAGNTIISYDSGRRTQVLRSAGLSFENAIKSWREKCTYCQPSVFFPRTAYEEVGGIRTDCEYVMDWDLIFRLLMKWRVVYIDHALSHIYLHKSCKTVGEAWRGVLVRRYAARDYWAHLPGGYKRSYKLLQAFDLLRSAGGRMRDGNLYSAGKIVGELFKVRFWRSAGLSPELADALCRM